MSTYRRNFELERCQRWLKGVWVDCPLNKPETRVRELTEGMVVNYRCTDFEQEGPLALSVEKILEQLKL